MASKDRPHGRELSICPICEDVIRERKGKTAGEDAVYCDGLCDAWLHRRCAGLSKAAFQQVTAAPKQTLFYCPHCRISNLEKEILSLKSSVDVLAKETLNHAKESSESVSKLRADLEVVQSAVTSISSPHSSDTDWGHSSVNPRKRSTNRRPHLRPHQDKPVVAPQRGVKRRPTVIVRGSRKIWGTRRSDDVDYVSSVLGEIISSNLFSVKRKFKSSTPSSPNRWWYVIRADEDVLTTLVANWASSNGWSIDYLHRFHDYDGIDTMSSPSPRPSSDVPTPTDSGVTTDSGVATDSGVTHADAAPPTSPLQTALAQANSPPPPAND